MKNILILILLLASASFAQTTFDLKNASKYFDVKVEVEKCDGGFCEGAATFSFYKKGGVKPYQVIKLADTSVQLGDDDGKPLVNTTLLYDAQSVVNIDDFNFDGMEDVAICDGTNGSYNGPSYRIYLSSRAAGKFVFNQKFTDLAYHLGMFTVDKKAKTLETFDKSGCCWHTTERYKVIGNRPVKVYEMVEDATGFDEKKNMRIVTTTEKTLVNGKWRRKVTTERVKDEN
jgi:hypothetical protein